MTTRPHGPRERDDAHERARTLQMEATLTELAGLAPATSLTDRILAELRGDAPAARCSRSNARSTSRWLVAAVVLAGASVVGGIAWFQHDGNRHAIVTPRDPERGDRSQQDPKPTPAPKQACTLVADYSENRVIVFEEFVSWTFGL